MRVLLTMFACLMLVVSAWSGAAQAADFECAEMSDQTALHVAGNCDEVPADADRGYPHCHTGCHGHHVATPFLAQAPSLSSATAVVFVPAGSVVISGHRSDPHLRPPQA